MRLTAIKSRFMFNVVFEYLEQLLELKTPGNYFCNKKTERSNGLGGKSRDLKQRRLVSIYLIEITIDSVINVFRNRSRVVFIIRVYIQSQQKLEKYYIYKIII